jgi:2-keto-3-deoxy-L-fuconate dehydrogenase
MVDTPMVISQVDGAEHERQLDDAGRQHVLGRVAGADELAALVTFMASDECAFMTGSAVVFDGGFTLASGRAI